MHTYIYTYIYIGQLFIAVITFICLLSYPPQRVHTYVYIS